jgi:hypothetical protein
MSDTHRPLQKYSFIPEGVLPEGVLGYDAGTFFYDVTMEEVFVPALSIPPETFKPFTDENGKADIGVNAVEEDGHSFVSLTWAMEHCPKEAIETLRSLESAAKVCISAYQKNPDRQGAAH